MIFGLGLADGLRLNGNGHGVLEVRAVLGASR
jgi:hypothetical protein